MPYANPYTALLEVLANSTGAGQYLQPGRRPVPGAMPLTPIPPPRIPTVPRPSAAGTIAGLPQAAVPQAPPGPPPSLRAATPTQPQPPVGGGPQAPQGMWDRLKAGIKDPRTAMVAATIAARLGQPRQLGESSAQAFTQALVGGYGALGQVNELRRKHDLEERELRRKEAESRATIRKTVGETGKLEAETGAIPRKLTMEEQDVATRAAAQKAQAQVAEFRANLDAELGRGTLAVSQQQAQQHARDLDQQVAKADADRDLAREQLAEAKRHGMAQEEIDRRRARADEVSADAALKRATAEISKIAKEVEQLGGITPDVAARVWSVVGMGMAQSLSLIAADPEEKRKAMQAAGEAALDSLTKRFGVKGREGGTGGGTVRMRAPTGEERDVPADQVENFTRQGAVVIR